MNEKAKKEFDKIISNKFSGSGDLLSKIILFLKKYFSDIDNPAEFIEYAFLHFDSFENIKSFLNKLEKVNSNKKISIEWLDKYFAEYNFAYENIFISALPFMKDKKSILTISNSRTVIEIIKKLSAINSLRIIVSESRPKLEGRILAAELVKNKIKVDLITEAMSAMFIKQCDCVLIGSDMILKDGSIINKVGSLHLAMLCRTFKKPFYVVADKTKFSKRNKFHQKEESASEIWKNHPEGIIIKNFYFEKIPASLVTKIFTDR